MSAIDTILVTGASGFLGRRVVARLRDAGAHVVATAGRDAHGIDRAVDLFDQQAVERMLADVRPVTVVHLAWSATPGQFATDPRNAAWTASTLLLADRAVARGTRSFVAAGSCAEPPSPLPVSLYGAAKAATRDVLTAWSAEVGIRFAWGRIFYVYAEDEPAGKLLTTAARVLADRGVFALRTPDDELDFVHADDVADAFVRLVDGGAEGVFDIGSGAATRVEDAAATLARLLGRGTVKRDDALRAPRRIVAETGALSAHGWQARITLGQGLARIASSVGE